MPTANILKRQKCWLHSYHSSCCGPSCGLRSFTFTSKLLDSQTISWKRHQRQLLVKWTFHISMLGPSPGETRSHSACCHSPLPLPKTTKVLTSKRYRQIKMLLSPICYHYQAFRLLLRKYRIHFTSSSPHQTVQFREGEEGKEGHQLGFKKAAIIYLVQSRLWED